MAPVRTGAISPSGFTTGKTMTDEKAAAKDNGSSSAKTGSSTSSDAPANYSRGEGQKPVSAAYRDNWNLIFGNKAAKPTAAKASAGKRAAKAKTASAKTAKAGKKTTKAKKKR
jgi:hypothetical protein